MSVNERLEYLINKEYNGNKRAFAKAVGISPTVVENIVGKRQGKPSFDVLYKIYASANINMKWLIAGEGAMLIGDKEDNEVSKYNNDELVNLIPVYGDVNSVGGYNDRVADLSPVSRPSGYINIGTLFKGGTCAIVHIGDSMVEYKSGCLLILREIQGSDVRYISSGSNYVIETDSFRVTKKVSRGREKDTLTLYSTNEDCYVNGDLIHPPFIRNSTII